MKPIILPLTETTRLHISIIKDKLNICKEKLADFDGNKLPSNWEPDAQHEYSDCTITITTNELAKFVEQISRLEGLLLLK
jgi:hypothetical protein